MKPPHPQQLDLFAQIIGPVRWSQEDRQKAMAQLQVLLAEAMSRPCVGPKAPSPREASDEQDHR